MSSPPYVRVISITNLYSREQSHNVDVYFIGEGGHDNFAVITMSINVADHSNRSYKVVFLLCDESLGSFSLSSFEKKKVKCIKPLSEEQRIHYSKTKTNDK